MDLINPVSGLAWALKERSKAMWGLETARALVSGAPEYFIVLISLQPLLVGNIFTALSFESTAG